MNSNTLVKKIESLSQDDRKKVLNFIQFISRKRNNLQKKTTNFEDEPFIGMWKSRDEMRDSSTWVREIRKSDWNE